jgi:hypothetical protein
MFRAVNASAPAANSPAPSASSRPRAAPLAISRRGSLPGPGSWRASQPPAGTISTWAAAGARPAAAIPPGVHWMPRWEAADRIITGTTLGEHDRLCGPFGDNADTQVSVRPGALHRRRRCSSAARRAARRSRARPQPRRRRKRPPRKAQQCSQVAFTTCGRSGCSARPPACATASSCLIRLSACRAEIIFPLGTGLLMRDVVRRLVERRSPQLVMAAAAGGHQMTPAPALPRLLPASSHPVSLRSHAGHKGALLHCSRRSDPRPDICISLPVTPP